MTAVVKFVKKAVKNVGTAIKRTADAVVKTVDAVIKDPLPTLLAVAGQAVGIPVPVTQAAITAARGGDLEDIAKSAAIAYVTPKIASTIAPTVNTAVGSVVTNEGAKQALTAATSQALVAGSLTAATGGDGAQAAAGAFAGSLAVSGYDKYIAPEVAAQTKSLGLSPETINVTQDILKSGVAGGTGTLAAGGDFGVGFANAAAGAGWDNLTTKVAEGFQDIKKTYLKDQGIKDNPPTAAGIPDTLVAEVPKGQFAQTVPTLEEQLAQSEALPGSPEYGKQLGPPLAALGSIGGVELKPTVAGSGDTTGELLFPDSTEFSVGVNQKAGPISEISIDGKKYLKRDVTENGVTTTHYFDPVDKEVTSAPAKLEGELTVGSDGEITKTLAPMVIEGSKDLPPPTPSEQSQFVEELKKSAITGDIAPLTANTQFGPVKPEEIPAVKTDAGILSPQQISRLVSNASNSAALAQETKIKASVNPTPKNIVAAKDAELQAELDKNALDNAKITVEQKLLEPTAPPKEIERVETPLGSVSLSMARAFGTPENLMAAIRSGAVKTEPISPVKTQPVIPVDPTTRPSPFETTVVRPTDGEIKASTTPSNLPYEFVDRLILNASNASAAASNAQIEASVNPTPENIAAAQDAQLNAELAGKELSNAVNQLGGVSQAGSQVDGSTGVSTSESGAVPGAGVTPGVGTLPGAGDLSGTGDIAGDGTTPGAGNLPGTGTTPGAGNLPGDVTTAPPGEDLLGDNLPAVDEIDLTAPGAPKPDGVPPPGGSSGSGGISIPAIIAGGLATLPLFTRPTGPNYLPSKGIKYFGGTPVEIDTNSLIMMSPDEYARRTKLSSMFSVARGGLITLKKQR